MKLIAKRALQIIIGWSVFTTVAMAAMSDSTNNYLPNPQTAITQQRVNLGSVPVAFYYNGGIGATPNCPPTATSSTPVAISAGGTLYNYDMTAAFSLPAFIICNIGINYWRNEIITTVAAQVYGLSNTSAPCSSAVVAGAPNPGLFTGCQMNPIPPPNTSVCYDSTPWESKMYPTGTGHYCLWNGSPYGSYLLASAYGPNQANIWMQYPGGAAQNIPACGQGAPFSFYAPITGNNINYNFNYGRVLALYPAGTNCGISQGFQGDSVCDFYNWDPHCVTLFPNIPIKPGYINVITIDVPAQFNPASVISGSSHQSWSFRGTTTMSVTASATGKY